MKKTIYFRVIAVAFISLQMPACTDEEDIAPSHADQNLFAPDVNDNGTEASIRRQFFSETGTYILFNDTLKNEQHGTDIYGNPIYRVETVDIGYPFIGDASSSYVYTYKYLTGDEEKKRAAAAIKDYLMKRLGRTVPYSVLAVDSIFVWKMLDGSLQLVTPNPATGAEPYPKFYSGTRCMAISLHGSMGWKDKSHFDGMFKNIVNTKVSNLGEAKLKEFYQSGEPYYGVSKKDLGMEQGMNDSIAQTLGFWKDFNQWIFARKDADLKNFTDAVCDYSFNEVKVMMEGLPIVIRKFEIIRNIVLDMGIKLDQEPHKKDNEYEN